MVDYAVNYDILHGIQMGNYSFWPCEFIISNSAFTFSTLSFI